MESSDIRPLFNISEDSNSQMFNILLRIKDIAINIVKEQIGDMYVYFPFERQPLGEIYIDERHIVARINWEVPGRILSASRFYDADIRYIKEIKDIFYNSEYLSLKENFGTGWFDREKYTYIATHHNGEISSLRFYQLITDWLNDILIDISKENRTRILRAIPEQPMYDIEPFFKMLWVLESDANISQGTGFSISENRIVTCSHCVFEDTVLFRYDNYNTKYGIKNIKKNDALDLAIIDIDIPLDNFVEIGQPDQANHMDHVLILGHPNYRIGDTVNIQPGLISGFRMPHGVRRLLTNAHIVAGCSGGPALDAHGKVLGVAVTGADWEGNADRTEDHGIIPINAIELL